MTGQKRIRHKAPHFKELIMYKKDDKYEYMFRKEKNAVEKTF
ncbi:MAG: hypothetical protein BAJATHORv1_20103 [Candidatus Thorarchaeota archaeon]|nr:MAG: hypothetical protein BAJATHORv1_20103 [Candidatus Thorarchaeota archaeon]